MKHLKGSEKVQCQHWCERRSAGRRYVNARWQCSRETWHPSGYCSAHRYPYRWTEQDLTQWELHTKEKV